MHPRPLTGAARVGNHRCHFAEAGRAARERVMCGESRAGRDIGGARHRLLRARRRWLARGTYQRAIMAICRHLGARRGVMIENLRLILFWPKRLFRSVLRQISTSPGVLFGEGAHASCRRLERTARKLA